MKLWLYQFSVIPSLSWPFQVYDFPLAFARGMEKSATRYLKRWAGLYRNADVDILYRPREKFGLGLTSCTAHLKAMQVIKCHLVKHSKEGGSGMLQRQYLLRLEHVKTFSRRWKPFSVLEDAEAKSSLTRSLQVKLAGRVWASRQDISGILPERSSERNRLRRLLRTISGRPRFIPWV